YFGEMSLDGGVRSASVMTLEPCTCAVLGSAEVRACLAQHPDLAFDLLMQVIRRARTATDTARGMALLTVYGRVAALLQSLHGPAAEGASVTLRPITHQDIANRTGSSREMVSRLLKEMEKGGYIELGVKRIILLKKLPPRW
ncbi:MAG: Crp/Fnr family transcriptional regulator, partial [Rhodoferax sp.]